MFALITMRRHWDIFQVSTRFFKRIFRDFAPHAIGPFPEVTDELATHLWPG